MASNSLGKNLKLTTWGESHGKAIGVVVDGFPAGLEITEAEIHEALTWRRPGQNNFTSPRTEKDAPQILSGVFEGKTTGAPISILILNDDADSSKYEPIKDLLRPGHANYTYSKKYGIFDHRGGGRASARETAARVAAGALAKKFLLHYGIDLVAYIKQIGPIQAEVHLQDLSSLRRKTLESPLFCPDPKAAKDMESLLQKTSFEGDSWGGIVEFLALSVPAGLGDPVYDKLEALLAFALMSLPAAKGFEIGSGFQAAEMLGSEHNDVFIPKEGKIQTATNYAGGTLGGISTGMPLEGRVAFKPTSSIKKPQNTLTTEGEAATFNLPEGSRHDPCVAIRAVPVVEAMVAWVLADTLLTHRGSRL